MKTEKSCGAVVFIRGIAKTKYLLVKQKNGYYGFPKGHMENEETELETARREIKEEVGLNVDFIGDFRQAVEYQIPDADGTVKTVVYFLAEFKRQKIKIQESEIEKYALVDYHKAMELIKYENIREVLKNAANYYKELRKNEKSM